MQKLIFLISLFILFQQELYSTTLGPLGSSNKERGKSERELKERERKIGELLKELEFNPHVAPINLHLDTPYQLATLGLQVRKQFLDDKNSVTQRSLNFLRKCQSEYLERFSRTKGLWEDLLFIEKELMRNRFSLLERTKLMFYEDDSQELDVKRPDIRLEDILLFEELCPPYTLRHFGVHYKLESYIKEKIESKKEASVKQELLEIKSKYGPLYDLIFLKTRGLNEMVKETLSKNSLASQTCSNFRFNSVLGKEDISKFKDTFRECSMFLDSKILSIKYYKIKKDTIINSFNENELPIPSKFYLKELKHSSEEKSISLSEVVKNKGLINSLSLNQMTILIQLELLPFEKDQLIIPLGYHTGHAAPTSSMPMERYLLLFLNMKGASLEIPDKSMDLYLERLEKYKADYGDLRKFQYLTLEKRNELYELLKRIFQVGRKEVQKVFLKNSWKRNDLFILLPTLRAMRYPNPQNLEKLFYALNRPYKVHITKKHNAHNIRSFSNSLKNLLVTEKDISLLVAQENSLFFKKVFENYPREFSSILERFPTRIQKKYAKKLNLTPRFNPKKFNKKEDIDLLFSEESDNNLLKKALYRLQKKKGGPHLDLYLIEKIKARFNTTDKISLKIGKQLGVLTLNQYNANKPYSMNFNFSIDCSDCSWKTFKKFIKENPKGNIYRYPIRGNIPFEDKTILSYLIKEDKDSLFSLIQKLDKKTKAKAIKTMNKIFMEKYSTRPYFFRKFADILDFETPPYLPIDFGTLVNHHKNTKILVKKSSNPKYIQKVNDIFNHGLKYGLCYVLGNFHTLIFTKTPMPKTQSDCATIINKHRKKILEEFGDKIFAGFWGTSKNIELLDFKDMHTQYFDQILKGDENLKYGLLSLGFWNQANDCTLFKNGDIRCQDKKKEKEVLITKNRNNYELTMKPADSPLSTEITRLLGGRTHRGKVWQSFEVKKDRLVFKRPKNRIPLSYPLSAELDLKVRNKVYFNLQFKDKERILDSLFEEMNMMESYQLKTKSKVKATLSNGDVVELPLKFNYQKKNSLHYKDHYHWDTLFYPESQVLVRRYQHLCFQRINGKKIDLVSLEGKIQKLEIRCPGNGDREELLGVCGMESKGLQSFFRRFTNWPQKLYAQFLTKNDCFERFREVPSLSGIKGECISYTKNPTFIPSMRSYWVAPNGQKEYRYYGIKCLEKAN